MSQFDEFDELDELEDGHGAESRSGRFGGGSIRQALSRWWLMVLFGILGYAAGMYYLSIISPKSAASAVLEVNTKEKQIIGAELESEQTGSDLFISTTVSKLMAPDVLAEVAESPEVQSLARVIPPKFSVKPRSMRTEEEMEFLPASEVKARDIASRLGGSWLEVAVRPGTTLIDVTVTHEDPETARVLADTLLRVFLERQQENKEGGARVVFEAMKSEADEARRDLEDAQKSVQVYVAATKLSEQLQAARSELLQLRQRYKAKHPKLIQFSSIYTDLNKRFRREIQRASSAESEKSFWMNYRDSLDVLDERVREENDYVGDAADEWLSLAQNALAARANLLNTRIAQSQQLFDRLTKRLAELDVADEGELDEYSIQQSAVVTDATGTRRLQTLAMGSVLGVLGGFGIAYLLGVIDYKIYDVRSAEEITGLSCMAALPASSDFDRKEGWAPVLVRSSNSMQAEAIRNLRASVVLLGQKHRHKTLLITSAVPGEGKTVVAAELAASFALNKEKTLLVGMDLRKPRLENMFPKLKGHPGMSDLLAGQSSLEECILKDDHENLYLLGAGSRAANPSELLHEDELREVFGKLSADFDRIVIDSAPVLPVSDSRVLAGLVQTVILVVRARKAPVGAVLRSIDLLEAAGKAPVGAVINGLKKSSGSGYYGYKGYGEYGGEYGYYDDAK